MNWKKLYPPVKCECCKNVEQTKFKSINRWMAKALQIVGEEDKRNYGQPIHASTLLQGTEGLRDHCFSLWRHWGAIAEVDRPEDAPKSQKGSRGKSGFYVLTERGRAILNGAAFNKTAIRPPGHADWILVENQITLADALKCSLIADGNNIVHGETDA